MKKKKVFIGLSGGVDSSVAATLLKEAGYDVTGVFIKVYEPPQEKFQKVCTWRDDRRDAMRVASQLKIPFKTIDLGEEYKKGVVDYMINEYKKGRTPNPDVMCNKIVKFGAFYDWAIKSGADFVATGHYAQVVKNGSIFTLKKGIDENKDQTYFLWNIKKEQLSKILFPIGSYEKTKTREIAETNKLATAEKKDSQGLCFIGKLNVKDFLKEFIAEKEGPVLNEKGEVIGHHEGVFFYTLGERRGFVIDKKTSSDKPYFIIAKDLKNNTLTVSSNPRQKNKAKNTIVLEDTNWLIKPAINKNYTCQYRYRGKYLDCKLENNDDKWTIILSKAESDIAPGQSIVVYDGDTCLGGGVIK